MPFDETLARRARALLRGARSLNEKRMFGGLAFMVNGHMCCGVTGKNFVVCTGPDAYEVALSQPHARPMDITGRPMRGFVYVDPPGCRSTRDLKAWVQRGLHFVLISTAKMNARRWYRSPPRIPPKKWLLRGDVAELSSCKGEGVKRDGGFK